MEDRASVAAEPDLHAGRKRRERRSALHRLRDAARAWATSKSCRACGRTVIDAEGAQLLLRRADSHAYFRGIATCGSVWACPICAMRVAMERADDLDKIAAYWRAAGNARLDVALTVAHERDDDLGYLRRGLTEAFRLLRQGRAYKRFQARFRVRYHVRVLEVTHGWEHGCHPHLHASFFVVGALNHDDAALAQDMLSDMWESAIERAIGATHRPSRARGVRVEVGSGDMRYLAKSGLEMEDGDGEVWRFGAEMAGAAIKRAKGKSRTPFQILEDAIRDRDPLDIALWKQYTTAMRGARQFGYSASWKELRALAGLDVERTDAQLAEEQTDAVDVISPRLRVGVWRLIEPRACELRDIAEVAAETCVSLGGRDDERLAYVRDTVRIWIAGLLDSAEARSAAASGVREVVRTHFAGVQFDQAERRADRYENHSAPSNAGAAAGRTSARQAREAFQTPEGWRRYKASRAAQLDRHASRS